VIGTEEMAKRTIAVGPQKIDIEECNYLQNFNRMLCPKIY